MALDIAIVSSTTGNGGGDSSFEKAGYGTPQGALFITSWSGAAGVAADAAFGVGATDGTNHFAIGVKDDDNLGTTQAGRRAATDECLIYCDKDGAVNVEAAFKEWATNGATITWSADPGEDYVINCVLFKGFDNLAVGSFTAHATENSSVSVNLGWRPDAVIFFAYGNAIDDAAHTHGILSAGFAVDDGSDTQRMIAFGSQDNVATSDIGGILDTTSVGGQVLWSGVSWTGEIAFTATGFDCTSRDGGAGGDDFGYIAFQYSSGSFWCGTVTPPTAVNGNTDFTDPNFEPSFVMQVLSMHTAINSHDATGLGGAFGISLTDMYDTDQYEGLSIEDGQGTSDCDRVSSAAQIDLNADDGSAAFDATHVDMISTGWRSNFTVADGTQRYFIGLAMGETVSSVSASPSGSPSASLSASPSASPSGSPSEGTPSGSPSEGTPSASPSATPSGSPSGSPSASPSEGTPSGSPSEGTPSASPSEGTPSGSPSEGTPSASPSGSPSGSPSEGTPSASPSGSPSESPSGSPSEGTPSASPSASLSGSPSASPSGSPSASPSEGTPSGSPSASPSGSPSASPSEGTPSASPSTGVTELIVEGVEITGIKKYVHIIADIKTGTTQANAGAAAGEIWADTAEEYSLKVGV